MRTESGSRTVRAAVGSGIRPPCGMHSKLLEFLRQTSHVLLLLLLLLLLM